jgi:NodT family efflux transporter outer membrane factor (OMF) lipoprotein
MKPTSKNDRAHNLPRARVLAVATLASVVLALPACKVGPDYEAPDAEVHSRWRPETMATPQSVAPRWWETFNDPVLTRLVEDAAEQNLTVRTAGLRVIEARARRSIAVGRFFPQAQAATGDVGNTRLSGNTPLGQGADRSFSESSLGLEAAWELDFWGRFRRGIESADAELLATVADHDAVMTSVLADVATNYILVRSFQERIAIARSNVTLQESTLALTEVRFRAGAVSEFDVAAARSTLSSTRAVIPELEDGLEQSRLALGVLLGRAPSDLEAELAPADGAARLPTAPGSIAAGIPADLLRRRPDIRAAERRAAAQSAQIGVAAADLYPRISIAGVTGFASSTFEGSRSPGLGNTFDADSFAGFIGLRLNWPLFNYGRIRGNIRAQDALYEQAVAAYQEAVIRAAADVEGGLSAFLRASERAGHLGEGVTATRRSFDLSLLQYRAGLVDFIRLNDAQTRLERQEDELVDARTRIALGAVRTYRALGGGWEIRQGREYVDDATAQRMRDRTNWGDVLSGGPDVGRDPQAPAGSAAEPVAQPRPRR